MRSIDELDRNILRILLEDASLNYETIANRVDTSLGTIHNRIKRMKETKIIERIVPEIDAKKIQDQEKVCPAGLIP